MFGVAGAPEFIEPKQKIWPAIAKWTDYRGAHETCDVYKQLVHEAGDVSTVARHQPASRKRTGPNGIMLVCANCATTLKTRDDMAARQRKERVEYQQQVRTARTNRPVA